MRFSNREDIDRWVASIDDQRVQNRIREMVVRAELPPVFIPDAIVDQVRMELNPTDCSARIAFATLRFNSH